MYFRTNLIYNSPVYSTFTLAFTIKMRYRSRKRIIQRYFYNWTPTVFCWTSHKGKFRILISDIPTEVMTIFPSDDESPLLFLQTNVVFVLEQFCRRNKWIRSTIQHIVLSFHSCVSTHYNLRNATIFNQRSIKRKSITNNISLLR